MPVFVTVAEPIKAWNAASMADIASTGLLTPDWNAMLPVVV
jgi:hypothetical protein